MAALPPMMKYVGSKARIADAIVAAFPESISAYSEPFMGSAAIFGKLRAQGRLDGAEVVLGDFNPAIVRFFLDVRDDVGRVVRQLARLERAYREEPESVFYDVRAEWNAGGRSSTAFLFLKQAAFNGLWRESAKGKFNAPWCQNPKVHFPEEGLLRAWSAALAGVSIVHCDALRNEEVRPRPGAVAYFDPPYAGTFDAYLAGGFGFHHHADLLSVVHRWLRAGAFVGYSNGPDILPILGIAWPTACVDHIEIAKFAHSGGKREKIHEVYAHERGGRRRFSGKVAA